MKFTPNLVVGVVLTMVGAVLTLDRLGIAVAWSLFQYWPVLLVVFGLSVVVQAIRSPANGNGNGNGHRHRPIITPGLVFLMIIGGMLVSSASQRFQPLTESSSNDDRLTLFGVMSRDTRTSYATAFQGANMTSVMGSSRLDLRQAMITPGQEAVIDVFGMMGEVQVVVPEAWTVEVRTVPMMGRVRDQRFGRNVEPTRADRRLPPLPQLPEAPAPATGATAESATTPAPDTPAASGPPPKLVIRGFVMMGALVIRS